MIWILIQLLLFSGTPSGHFWSAPVAQAANGEAPEGLLNKLLAPGPLIEAHKELEGSKCLECHEPNKGIPDSKCLACHANIKEEVVKKGGFHGLTTQTCIACHSDHKGRDFDSTQVDMKTFNHNLTGYQLVGKHAQLKCTDCHIEKRSKQAHGMKIPRLDDPRYVGLKVTCVSCHKKDDVHYFKGSWAKKDCNACHSPVDWKKDVHFDHLKDAHYKLVGKHASLSCAECHVPKKTKVSIYHWKNLKKNDCLSCHADQHRGKMSPQFQGGHSCVKCHTQTTWKVLDFNHSMTGYPLKGKHATTDCIGCHKQSPNVVNLKDFKFTGLRTSCSSCHIDHHNFGNYRSPKLGNLSNCTQCHDENSWKETPKFNHNTDTRYPISGQHIGLDCSKCHVINPYSPGKKYRIYHWAHLADKTCENCHASPHKKTFTAAFLKKRCTECHTDQGWKLSKNGKAFDHSKTRFPLTGEHRKLACAQCHQVNGKEVYKFDHSDKGFCIACHQNVHVGQFESKFSGQMCTSCHTTKDFSNRLPFKHDETDFKLTGKHTPLNCAKCHTPTKDTFPLMPHEKTAHFKSRFIFSEKSEHYCIDCHVNPHTNQFRGSFAKQTCIACHTTEDFTHQLAFDHNKTTFVLRGKHADLQCVKCHVPTQEKFSVAPFHVKSKYLFPSTASKDCTVCHKDPHEGKYGQNCTECHNEVGWKTGTVNFHKNFTLIGVHYTLQCAECHKDNRKLEGLSQMCIACHQKDDIHHGALPDCGKCHEQHFWEDISFQHSMTNFPLRGAHRTLDCSACHSNNIYKGLPDSCSNCHLRDALGFTGTPNHQLLIGQNCANCHNQFSFH